MSFPADLHSAQLLGQGLTADVYAWGRGRVLKLFFPRFAHAKAAREAAITSAIHAAGGPAPAAHALVEVAGRAGIVLERLDGPSLFDAVQARPWTLGPMSRRFADLHARLHQLEAPAALPEQRERLSEKIERAAAWSEQEKSLARAALAALPDGTALCHGDFHPANIILTTRGPMIIDWETASRGDPLGDVARTVHLLRHAPAPANAAPHMRLLLNVARSLLLQCYLSRYERRRPGTRAQIAAWSRPAHAVSVAWQGAAASAAKRRS